MGATGKSLFPNLSTQPSSARTTGILPSQAIRELIAGGRIEASIEVAEEQIQPASIDLRLGEVAYRVRASFLPGSESAVQDKISSLLIAKMDLTGGVVFEPGCVYIVPLMEELRLPKDVEARANPKSTTGRLDVFTRLITDYGVEFERVRAGYRGKLYAEIVSGTFTIQVRTGTKLNQLRFIRGNPPSHDGPLAELDERENLVYEDEEGPVKAKIDKGLRISVRLNADGETDLVAFRAKKHAPVIDLGVRDFYDPREYWDAVYSVEGRGIVLEPGDFYILASKEKVRVPPDYAAEMVPYDQAIGEFRVHYAGFFDPGFGYGTSDVLGTLAVLEVRAHEVPILIEHAQTVGRLIYSPMMGRPEKIYGVQIGSSYQMQGLALSKQFKRWP
ncbi:MAG: 2'-deoxycytidine 5'-triphosphate deaminase [Terriglobia bacterium]|jgi:dCTP deaminase